MGRLWHYKLIPYLSNDLIAQLRKDLIRIIRNWQFKKYTDNPRENLLLRQYPGDVKEYLNKVYTEYWKRYNKSSRIENDETYKSLQEFLTDCESLYLDYYKFAPEGFFSQWHTEEYLDICMTELYECFKYSYGVKRITGKEWDYYLRHYKEITGHEFTFGLTMPEVELPSFD